MTDTTTTAMPAYTHSKTQKTVHALKIANVGPLNGGPDGVAELSFDAPVGPIPVDKAFITKYKPTVGGYYVQDEDGNASYSAAATFEAAYKLSKPSPSGPPVVESDQAREERLAREARTGVKETPGGGPARPLTAGKFFTTANRAAAIVTAALFDPLVKPWPAGVLDDAQSPTKYSVGGGLNQPGFPVAPGDWIVVDATGVPRVMNAVDFEATYTSVADAGEADPMALEKFLRRVARPVFTCGISADGVTFRLTSIDQSDVLEGFVEGNTFVVTPAPKTTNV